VARKSSNEIALDALVQELKRELVPILSIPRAWLDEKEAAGYLRLSVFSLRAWRSRDEGPPFYRVGNRVVYKLGEIDRWMEKHRVKGNG